LNLLFGRFRTAKGLDPNELLSRGLGGAGELIEIVNLITAGQVPTR
jgi:hypothetical protein